MVRFCCAASETSPCQNKFPLRFSWAGDWQANDPKPRQRNYSRFDIGRMAAQMLLSKIKNNVTTTTLLTSGIRFITATRFRYFLFITRILFAGRCLYSRQELEDIS